MGIDQDPSIRFQARRHIDGSDQRWIKNNDVIGLINIDPQIDGLVIHPQESHDRRSSPFNSKSGEGLDVEALVEKSHGKHFGCHHGSLATPSMKSNLNHRS